MLTHWQFNCRSINSSYGRSNRGKASTATIISPLAPIWLLVTSTRMSPPLSHTSPYCLCQTVQSPALWQSASTILVHTTPPSPTQRQRATKPDSAPVTPRPPLILTKTSDRWRFLWQSDEARNPNPSHPCSTTGAVTSAPVGSAYSYLALGMPAGTSYLLKPQFLGVPTQVSTGSRRH